MILPISRRYIRVDHPSVTSCAELPRDNSRRAAHGVTTNAMTSEKSIAADAPTGIGRMYGPISPRTKPIGRMAAITANVARMVGFPTSATASTAIDRNGRPSFSGRR